MGTKSTKSLSSIQDEINKLHGVGSIATSDEEFDEDIRRIPTGVIALDLILGGGLPTGRIVDLYGVPSGGKSGISLSFLAEAQKYGKCVFIDLENAYDPEMARKSGIDTSELIVVNLEAAEDIFELIEDLVLTGEVSAIVVDSFAGLVPRAELEGDIGDSVTHDVPVYIRNKMDQSIDIVPICDLYKGTQDFGPGTNEPFSYQKWYKKHSTVEVLTHDGWSEIEGVVKKINKENKPVLQIRTTTSLSRTTADHCLFKDGGDIAVSDLTKFDRIDHHSPDFTDNLNKYTMTPEVAWLIGFWVAEGTYPRSRGANRYEVSNTDLTIIEKCKKYLDAHFITKTSVRRSDTDDKRRDLYILNATGCQAIGELMREATCENAKLKKVPKLVLNGTNEIKEAFLEGFWEGDGSHSREKSLGESYFNDSMPVIAGLRYLMMTMGWNTPRLNIAKVHQMSLSKVKGNSMLHSHEIRRIDELPAPQFLYDMATEAGTFINACGDVVTHNSHVGLIGRLSSQFLRVLTKRMKKEHSETIIVFINQLRANIGGYGNAPATTVTGGQAVKFYASTRISVTRTGNITRGKDIVGHTVKVKTDKNRLAPPFQTAEFDIIYDHGISNEGTLIDAAAAAGLLIKKGNWYTDPETGESLGNGKFAVIERLSEDRELYDRLKNSIYSN